MVREALRTVMTEPRAPDPPRRVWRDWALVAVLVPIAVLEGVLRDDVVWRPLAILCSLLVIGLLPWRRGKPLATLALALGVISAVNIATIASGEDAFGLYITAVVLFLPYALFRWGSGREAAIGLGIMAVNFVTAIAADFTGVGESVAGAIVFLFPAVLGASVRYRSSARARGMEQVRLREREQLARELHDSVAHHVSAIAVQAQAGLTVADSDPDAAIAVLSIIENEASLTLTEMRTIVGSLRHGDDIELAPQRRVADVRQLAAAGGDAPEVDVTIDSGVDDLEPTVQAAIYRLAQESITNALRHSVDARRIDVDVSLADGLVHLTVRDDGRSPPRGGEISEGYGLLGMRERARLLGGTIDAGPVPEGGWRVAASLPQTQNGRR